MDAGYLPRRLYAAHLLDGVKILVETADTLQVGKNAVCNV